MSRRPARGQSLPPEIKAEIRFTAQTSRFLLRKLLASLYDTGWTLRALGEAFDPPIPRTTIREWVQEAPEDRLPAPAPKLKTPPPKPKKKPIPPISPSDRALLSALALPASNYRSGMSSFSTEALSNIALDTTIRRLYDAEHPVQDIANAAGLSRRAVYNRLKKTEKP